VGFAPLVFQNCHKTRRFPEEVVSASLRGQESFNGKLLFPGKSQWFALTLEVELPPRHVQAIGRLYLDSKASSILPFLFSMRALRFNVSC
jgi:hypothetical protein